MRLSTRLSVFFLTAIALVLLGFSIGLFALASRYLHRQVDERLDAALNTLAAAAEVTPAGVEWEPLERTLSFGRRTLEGPFRWQVCDERGERIDGSPAGELDRFLSDSGSDSGRSFRTIADAQGVAWRVMQRRLEPSRNTGQPFEDPEKPAVVHAALSLAAAVSLEGVTATLLNLALVLAGFSLSLWTLALVFGRRLSLRALKPVTRMAEAAHAIGGDDVDQRLPVPQTADELEELGRSFNALLSRLQDSFERQRRFTGDASHQLRTPLTALQGQVDLALRQERDVEEYKRVLGVVQRKTRHLRHIVESLLFLARADHETLAPTRERINLVTWLPEHVRSWQDSRGSPELHLVVVLERSELQGSVPVQVQPLLLAELVSNLLDNAARYSDPGTPIRISLEPVGTTVALTVEDQGIGIAEDEIAHLFEPFYRSPEARRRGASGLGLGLSVAARLASAFGGTIDVSSRPGQGSRFTLRLPLARNEGDRQDPRVPRLPEPVSPASLVPLEPINPSG
jgi:two-component system, OmpR family, sensor kinase